MSDQMRHLVDSARAQLQAELDAEFRALAARHDQSLAEARRAAEAEAEVRWAPRVDAARAEGERRASEVVHHVSQEAKHALLKGIHEIDTAQSISAVLTAIVRASAHEAPRVALFIGSGEPLEEWAVDGASPITEREQAAVAIPLLLDGEQVAVLYGHDDDTAKGVEGWRDGLAVFASHGALRLACITATRTAQAMRWLSGPHATVAGVTSAPQASSPEEEQAARRYARLLVSEIKLYNESAVRTGRAQRDLSRRLAPDIDRARHLYQQRISETVSGRDEVFHNELVQTLAGGDRLLLG